MAADECNIRVVARFRPLNDIEERAGSKSVVKFPSDQEGTLLISVCFFLLNIYHYIII
jgi:kinesin family protein 5